MPRKLAVCRAGRPPQRGEIDAFQPHDRHRAARSSRRSPGRRAMRWRGRSSWRGVDLPAVRYRGAVRRERGSAARAGRPAGAARDRRRRSAGVPGRWPRGPRLRRRDDRARAARDRPAGALRGQQDRRQARAGRRSEFYQLGFEPVFEISAEHGNGRRRSARRNRARGSGPGARGSATELGSGRRRETAQPRAPEPQPRRSPNRDDASRSSAGRTSASRRCSTGCCSEERVLVSDMPGTTRDAIDAPLTWHRRQFRIVDTAGMRRPGRVARRRQGRDWSASRGAKKAIFDADVVALLIDANEGATDQDAAIGGEADRAGRGIVIVANKWDLVKSRGPRVRQDLRRRRCGAGCGSSTTRRSSTSRR